jgi:hypothetical protein
MRRAFAFAERVAQDTESEPQARRAASALYNAASAVLLAWEGTRDPADARRALFAGFVLEHRLRSKDPLEADGGTWERPVITALLKETPVPLVDAAAMLEAAGR